MRKIIGALLVSFFLWAWIDGDIVFANTTAIPSGVPVTSEIKSSGTTHTYEFTTNKDGEIYVSLDQTTGGFSMYVYDMHGNYIGGDYWSTSGKTIVVNDNVVKGTYYVKVKPYEWSGISSAKYTLKATYASTINRDATTYEPNETIETSMKVSSGKFYSSKAESKIDRDMYQFSTSKDGEVYITLDSTTAGFSMYLYDIHGNYIDGDYWSTSGKTIVINEVLPKGTYFIDVDPYEWGGTTSATYRVKATFPTASFTRDSKTFEPNDTMETSLQVISGKSYSSNSYSYIDRDVYQFTTSKSGEANIVLDNTTGGYSVYIYDVHGNYVSSSYHSSAGNTLVLNETLAKGTYYIEIDPYGWSGITSAKYRLTASFIDKAPSINPMYDTSTSITGSAISNTTIYAKIGSTKVGEVTAKDGKYSIKISKQKAGTKISVYSVDSAGNTSATKTTTVVDSAIKTESTAYNKIKISWSKVPDVHGYEIYRSTSSSGTYSKVGTVTSGSTLNYTNSNVTTGKTYYYKIRAYRTVSGKKVYSPYTKNKSGIAIPSTPSSISAKKASKSSATLKWGKVDGASGYEVYRSTSKTGTYSKQGTITSGSTLSYTNKSLSTGKTYYYKVRAYRTVDGKKVYGNFSSILSYAHKK